MWPLAVILPESVVLMFFTSVRVFSQNSALKQVYIIDFVFKNFVLCDKINTWTVLEREMPL